MVVCTMTKKQIMRIAAAVLIAAAVILIVIFAVMGSVTASADEGKKPINRVDRGDNRIALTFDCAWDASDTDELLAILSDAGVKATFFVTGEFCDAHADAVMKMSAAGHSVQNGSGKNIHIKGMNINDLIADTNEAAQKIGKITGKMPEYYRAPYGDSDDKSLTTLEGMGYKVIGCSADSKDLEDPDAASVTKRILDNTASGSVLLFHNDSKAADEALPSLLTELKQKGFELVAIEDLVFSSDYVIDENGAQVYQPSISTALPILYSDNSALDSAFEKMRENLNIQQIYDLSSVGRVALVDEIESFLSAEELYAVREATYEELKECYLVLVYAAEKYGCGGTYTDPQYEEIPQIVTPNTSEEETASSEPVPPEEPVTDDAPKDGDIVPENISYYDKGIDPEITEYPEIRTPEDARIRK